MHRVIFPVKSTIDDVHPERMNLWIIEKRPSYPSYLASDTPFEQMEAITDHSKSRPDLLIFYRPIAFTDSGFPSDSMGLIESKRPERDDVSDGRTPIEQVSGYVVELKGVRVLDRRGRALDVPAHARFYVDNICDVISTPKDMAKFAGPTQAPVFDGGFGYGAKGGVSVATISFNELVDASGKRNAVLFEEIGLGS